MEKNTKSVGRNPIRISVRELVESVLRRGDLSMAFSSPKRAQEGIRVHQVVQKSRGEDYQKEVPVSFTVIDQTSNISLEIHGRIDGVHHLDDRTVIEEIKSTKRSLQTLNPPEDGLHFAQAKVYAFIFASNNQLEDIDVHLTYYQLATRRTKTFDKNYSLTELTAFFDETIDQYLEGIREIYHWQEIRNDSIATLEFPFEEHRPGQETFIEEVYEAVADGCNLFAQAPTGLGKTMAALFPAVKAMAQGHCTKIFYLTARTTTREAAEQALEQLRKKGLRLKSITLTAKKKICFKEEMVCHPEYCEHIKNYYGRLKTGLRDALTNDRLNRETVEKYARKHELCPFEFSLDLSLSADCVICDYNYLFDPRVHLIRYFSDSRQFFVFLVDEAHNLVDRSRDMYSAMIEKKDFLDLKRLVDKTEHPDLHACLQEINDYLLQVRKDCQAQDRKFWTAKEVSSDLMDLLTDFLEPAEETLSHNKLTLFGKELLDLYFNVLFFKKICQLSKQFEAYAVITQQSGSHVRIKLLCLDASQMIRQMTDKGISTVFFSATLSPSDYFFSLLGGNEHDRSMQLPSPFPEDNLCICLIDTISTKYRDRDKSYDPIAEYLSLYTGQRKGNYLVFFPSYRYLDEVYLRFSLLASDMELIRQESFMKESDRDLFLAEFSADREKSLVGFVVMGGIFAESIDLPGERLTGAAVVGVGLPQVNQERNLIRYHHDTTTGNGFHYAYTFPGMNRVLQAAGRLIRTESDKGSLLLIDDRFSTSVYRKLYPPEWRHMQKTDDKDHLRDVIREFWKS